MRRWTLACLALAVAATLALAAPAAAQDLSPDASGVVDYLLEDWQRQFSSTTIPHAMDFMDMEVDDSVRLEVIEHLRDNSSIARNLQWWGANNYLFTNLEKRIAKYLILLHERDGLSPTTTEASGALGVSATELTARLGFMARGGFLVSNTEEDLGFGLAPGYKRWAGPLQHNFHTVRIDGEKPLDVW